MSTDKNKDDSVLCDNTLYYQRGDRLIGVALPPLHPALEVRRVPEGHPAWPGHGLYVASGMRIAKDEQLGLYAGIYRLSVVADTTPCSFGLDAVPYCVDGQYEGNALRYANDPRGIADHANVWSEETWVSAGTKNIMTAAFFALEDVESDTELTLSYGVKYDMAMRPQPWRAYLPTPTYDDDDDDDDHYEDEDGTEPWNETRRERICRMRAGFAECEAAIARLSKLSRYFTDNLSLANTVHYWTLVGLGRKRVRLGALSAEEMNEATALTQFVRPLEETMRCRGPCGRVRNERHFGQPEWDPSFNFRWPPCNECCMVAGGSDVATTKEAAPEKRRRIASAQDNV